MLSYISHLECPQCHRNYSAEREAKFCICGSPLFAKYDLATVSESINVGEFPSKMNSMWRYSELLPVKSPSCVFSLGEGWTPLVLTRRLGWEMGLKSFRIKDESQNPTGSFKDRGLCAAISKHIELGMKSFALPSAGNAAVSTSAYCAAAGVSSTIFMPDNIPEPFFETCAMYGSDVMRVEGNISLCAAIMEKQGGDWTVLSTTKEPYRVEGKKTLGFEIAEQLGWSVPDAILCPTGGGTALLGIWKAFDELEAVGLIGSERPRMYAVQSEGCAPIVRAIEKGLDEIEPWQNPETKAYGLNVPHPFAGRLILSVLKRSGGGAVAVAEQDIDRSRSMVARLEGIDMGPEAAAGLTGVRNLVERGKIDPDEDVILLNTGSGSRYGFPELTPIVDEEELS